MVFFHGEPTWSFLWRKVIPPVRDAGFRCIAPDLAGFGRSDKPTDFDFYTYDRHSSWPELLEDLDLRGATAVVHDWGGPIGLRLAVEHPERIERLVIMDTGLFTGHQRMTDAWIAFRDFVERTEDLPVGMLVRGRLQERPRRRGDRRLRGPLPERRLEGGRARLPADAADDARCARRRRPGQRVLDALREDRRPTLMLWADSDPVLPLTVGERFAEAIGRETPRTIENASHFLQEDQGPLIGGLIAEWLSGA